MPEHTPKEKAKNRARKTVVKKTKKVIKKRGK